MDCFACVAGASLKTDSAYACIHQLFVTGELSLFAGVVRRWARVLKPSGCCCRCCCMGGGSCSSQQMPTELPTWLFRHHGAHLATAPGGDRLRLQEISLPLSLSLSPSVYMPLSAPRWFIERFLGIFWGIFLGTIAVPTAS